MSISDVLQIGLLDRVPDHGRVGADARRKISVTLSGTSTLTPDLCDTYVDCSRASGDRYRGEVQGPTPGDMPLPPLPTSLADNDPQQRQPRLPR